MSLAARSLVQAPERSPRDGAATALRRASLVARLLDLFSMPVLLVSAEGRVLHANHRAHTLLKTSGALFVTADGSLRTGRLDQSVRLRRLLRGLPTPPQADPVMRVTRDAGQAPLLLVVAALGEDDAALTSPDAPAAAVFIADPEACPEPCAERLAELYALTPAEALLAEALLYGKSLTEHAAGQNITRNTAKTHLKRIFAKTGATRQGELIRILLSGAAPLILRGG